MPTPSAARVHTATVVDNVQVAEGLWRLVFRAPKLAANISSGQFFSIAVPGAPKQLARIPLSFSIADFDAGTIETVYAVVGPGTQALSQMAPVPPLRCLALAGMDGSWTPSPNVASWWPAA